MLQWIGLVKFSREKPKSGNHCFFFSHGNHPFFPIQFLGVFLSHFPPTSAFFWGSGRPWKHCSAKPMSYHNSKRSGIKPWWNSLMITWWNDTKNIDIDQWKLKWRVLIKTYDNWWMMVTVACFLMFFFPAGFMENFSSVKPGTFSQHFRNVAAHGFNHNIW